MVSVIAQVERAAAERSAARVLGRRDRPADIGIGGTGESAGA
jgi:hypothetical protein